MLTVYGDDLLTEATDGMVSEEIMTIKSYNLAENREYTLLPQWDHSFAYADGKYVADGLSAISALKLEGVTGQGGAVPAAAGVAVYPNPAKDRLTIILTGFETLSGLSGTLLTADGRPVKTFQLTGEKTTVNISGMQAGVYLLSIETPDQITVKRIVITP